jgi:ABC-type transport system substrate-binding protein
MVAKGPQGKVVWAVRLVENIYGLPFLGPYRGSAGGGLGIYERLFWFDKGDPMAPMLAESWSVDPAGTKATIKIRKGIPWNPPYDAPGLDLGEIDAEDVVWWLNTGNSTTNPESTYPDAGDFAAVFLAAKATDKYTVEIGLVAPLYFGLPLSQFGLLGAERGPNSKKGFDKMGLKWMQDHEVGTGPFYQGRCIGNERCQALAVTKHWRQVPNIAELETVQVPEPTTRVAMMKSGAADLSELDFKLVPDLIKDPNSGIKYLETMPGGFVGISIMYSGNLYEEFHARTKAPLNPWNSPAYEKDYPWIGNPWGDGSTGGKCSVSATCQAAKYTDTDNPPGMTDMEQARLVRLALGTATDRNEINKVLLGGLGTPIYSEYMGPEYPGWDPKRWTGEWDYNSRTPIKASATGVGIPWELPFSTTEAEKLLDKAGYPRKSDGTRFAITIQAYPAEVGEVSLTIADTLVSMWGKIGVKTDQLREDYGGVISPRMRQRIQWMPVLKNGDVHSNVWPTDLPYPPVDSSISRPGWGAGFESVPLAEWHFAINAEKDKAKREKLHFDTADYMLYWQLYNGLVQVPKGVAATKRIKEWLGHQQHYSNVSGNPEFIVLN